ncbi:radical SAM family heme chaperone HemW [Pedobacter montanisoli]|uniref:Heme chaperone HemW n=1 Tax=Pedobacter montanisoli TaxID=2923277 RepID=A0ABS9ZSK1_9SPHI|nr:radical SAM family heme chaperone HemW [Pedobacter montanisoli]MCJ0741313.1 radical SAM family heme chaperone HemW [Pedobacter montanisoli]
MFGIYIHIPFCKQACNYCDFHFTTSFKNTDTLVDAICKEIILKKDRINSAVSSIYFGGGTPSVLPAAQLQKIFNTIEKHFSIHTDAEITLEANPDDLGQEKIKALRLLPVNRFSIGTQSFYNEDLQWMNRAHNAEEAECNIKRCQDAGFENLSIDLIYGFPLLSNEKWKNNIQTVLDLQIPHISAYALTVEPKTALAVAIKKGKQTNVNDEQAADQFMILTELLAMNGFEHYEISNYAKPGRYAVHNTNYWKGVPYLGIGPSAHGFDGTQRYININNNTKYIESILQNQLPEHIEFLTEANKFNEYIMTSLRTMWGIDLKKIETDFGRAYADKVNTEIRPFLKENHVILENNRIVLTASGKLFADGIAAELFTDPD